MILNKLIFTKIRKDELEAEKLINKFRFITAVLYSGVTFLLQVLRNIREASPVPSYIFITNNILLLFSVILFFYLRKKKIIHASFKYICVFFDMTIISVSIYAACGYPLLSPPVSYISIWALFYFILILTGAFRFRVRCAVFSGIYAGLCYLLVVILRADSLDLPYHFILDGTTFDVSFSLSTESFRVISMIVAGFIAGFASKRHLKLFSGIIESRSEASKTTAKIIKETEEMAELLKKSTEDIFLSSSEIFSTANRQAASIQEIKSTIGENSQIAGEIAEKTSGVASIAVKTEEDVNKSFSLLERNVEQMEEIKIKNDSVIYGIIDLSGKISKIRDIIESINAITDQTKVIAFNASLEAASAKEYGRRFSVVSSEVNRLADDIASLTKQIRRQADDIHGSSSSLITISRESAVKIKAGNLLIKELENIFREIKNGAENTADEAQTITLSSRQQQKTTEQINTAIADISNGLAEFIRSTEIAKSSAGDLTKLITELGDILSDGRNNDAQDTGKNISEAPHE